MPGPLDALGTSITRTAALVAPLSDDDILRPAYPSEWSIAAVLSHLGSGAEIFSRAVADALSGTDTPDGFNESVWATWNAKSPRQQVDDAVAASSAFVEHMSAVDSDDQARFSLALGPMTLGWEQFLSLRLNELVVHEWDVAVALDPAAVLAPDGVPFVLAGITTIAGFAARPTGPARTITIATSEPEQSFAIEIDAERVQVTEGVPIPPVDFLMPAESFVRLVYGRLDPAHTPIEVVVADDSLLPQLRRVFPGV